MATNYNIVDFSDLEFSGHPYGSTDEKIVSIDIFDNGYRVEIRRTFGLDYPDDGEFRYQMLVLDSLSQTQSTFMGLIGSEITTKLFEIQSL